MCFSPHVSITAAIIEFAIAGYIWLHEKSSRLTKFAIPFIVLLGFYQFTEFMLCVDQNVQLWGTLGFVAYTFLPPLGLNFVLNYTEISFKRIILYIPALIFSAIALFSKSFIIEGSCSMVFATVKNLFFNPENLALMLLYLGYYLLYIIICGVLLLRSSIKEKNKYKRLFFLIMALTLALTLLPALILIVILPSMGIKFPSMYCEFAFFFSVMILFGIYFSKKHKI